MTPSPASTHRKLRFPRGGRWLPVYASHYRFGTPTVAAPLLVYVGGAAPVRTYLDRASTEPVLLRDLVAAALSTHPLPALDVLVCPCPVDTMGQGTRWFVRHLNEELLPQLPHDPTAVAFAGYSAGAGYAIRAAILSEARAVALPGSAGAETELGAADLRDRLDRAHSEGRWSCNVVIYRNEKDGLISPAELAARVPGPMRAIPCPAGPGGHEFQDYVSNGTAVAAFLFLVRALAP